MQTLQEHFESLFEQFSDEIPHEYHGLIEQIFWAGAFATWSQMWVGLGPIPGEENALVNLEKQFSQRIQIYRAMVSPVGHA